MLATILAMMVFGMGLGMTVDNMVRDSAKESLQKPALVQTVETSRTEETTEVKTKIVKVKKSKTRK